MSPTGHVSSTAALVTTCVPAVCGVLGESGAIAKGAATKAASSMLAAMSQWVVGGATWLVRHAISLVAASTRVTLGAQWFEQREGAMLKIAALLVGPLLGAATIGAIMRQDGRRLVRVYGVGLPVGVLSAVCAVALTQYALVVVDAMCRAITAGSTLGTYGRLGATISSHGTPLFVQFIVGSFVVLAAVVLWMEMVLRAAVVYIAVFFLPVGLAAFVWPATAHITKRFAETLVAVIASKFVIVATLTLGVACIQQKNANINDAVTGTGILLLAAFAPFTVLRLVPLVEAAAAAHLEGLARRPARAAVAARSSAVGEGRRVAGMLGAFGGGAEGGLVAASVSPVSIGERAGEWSVPAGGSGGSPPASATSAASSDPARSVAGVPPPSSGSGGAERSGPAAPWASDDEPGPPTSAASVAAPSLPALPAVVPGVVGRDPDGWSADA